MLFLHLLLLVYMASVSLARNVDHTEFLQKYGYLPRGSNQLSSETMTKALKSMQRMAGLEETGELDERTKRMMERPRCGHPDEQLQENKFRAKRYSQQFKWNDKIITYGCKSVGTSTRVSLDDLRRTMRQAAGQWSQLADVEIVESGAEKPMIQISAGRAMHYPCTVPFDSMTLAHAFFPPHGQIHINDNVHFAMTNFTERTGGNSLYSVVAHEMGHALGFSHSPESDSVMFAYDTPRRWQFTPMDKYRMRMYYGTKATKTSEPNEEKAGEKEEERRRIELEKEREKGREQERDDIRPDECRVENPVVVLYRGEYLVFKSQWVWRVSSDWKRLVSKAVLVEQLFPGLPSPIDAAVTVEQNLWVFVEDKVFVISGNRILHAPFRLPEIGIDEKFVDLAYEWHYFNPPAIYIWKGTKYWKLDEKMYYRKVDERYPKDIDLNWARVPKGVHSAFTFQKEIHFIRNDQVFRMNSSRSVFDVADGFPISFREMFGFCPRNERLVLKDSNSPKNLFLALLILSLII